MSISIASFSRSFSFLFNLNRFKCCKILWCEKKVLNFWKYIHFSFQFLVRSKKKISKGTVKICIINWSKGGNYVRKYVRDGDDKQPSENRKRGSRHARVPLTTISRGGMILWTRRQLFRDHRYGSLREYLCICMYICSERKKKSSLSAILAADPRLAQDIKRNALLPAVH